MSLHCTLCETIVFSVLVTNDWRENRFCYNHFCQLEHHRRCKGFSGRLMWSVLTASSVHCVIQTASNEGQLVSKLAASHWSQGLLFVQKDTDLHLRHSLDSTYVQNNHSLKFLHCDSKMCRFWLFLIEVVPLLVTDVWITVHMTRIDKTKKSLWVCPTFFPSPFSSISCFFSLMSLYVAFYFIFVFLLW